MTSGTVSDRFRVGSVTLIALLHLYRRYWRYPNGSNGVEGHAASGQRSKKVDISLMAGVEPEADC